MCLCREHLLWVWCGGTCTSDCVSLTVALLLPSGACADAIPENSRKYHRATTETFLHFRIHNRPMSVPPHVIDGGSAAQGGVSNLIRHLFEEEDDFGEIPDVVDVDSPAAGTSAPAAGKSSAPQPQRGPFEVF